MTHSFQTDFLVCFFKERKQTENMSTICFEVMIKNYVHLAFKGGALTRQEQKQPLIGRK